jgi:hypothetical protein
MVAYTTRLPAGFPGQVSRDDALTIEAGIIDSSAYPTAYGTFCKVVSGKIRPIAASDAASVVHGLLPQPYPVQASTVVSALNSAAVPPTSGVIGVLRRGYMAVTLAQGTAAKKGQVYVRVVADTGKYVGDIEATADVTVAGGTITGTGTGTIAATVSASAVPGTWSLVLQSTSQTSKVTVIDPVGYRHPDATVGTAYSSGGLSFTITAAGTMTAGDSFSPVVTQNNVPVAACFFTGPADSNGVVEVEYNL